MQTNWSQDQFFFCETKVRLLQIMVKNIILVFYAIYDQPKNNNRM